jgi:hypothetical protein
MIKQLIVLATLALGLSTPALANNIFPSSYARVPNVAFMQGNLQYYGGPVLSNAKIYSIYWTPAVNPTVKAGMGAFYKALAKSDHLDWINEYATNIKAVDGRDGTNQTIGRGSFGGEYTITPNNPNKTLDDLDIRAELEKQIAAGVLPASDANSLYMFHFPKGYTITIEGATSCAQFCAYHMGYQSEKYGQIAYGIIPDLGSGMCSFGCGIGGTQFESTTVAASHEVLEAITDVIPTPGSSPAFPQAWNTNDGYEIGDLCQSTSSSLKSTQAQYTIQGEWDNATSSCRTGSYSSAPEFLRRTSY